MKIAYTSNKKLLMVLLLGITVQAYLTTENDANQCKEDEFFDSTALSCSKCPSTGTNKLVPTPDSKKYFLMSSINRLNVPLFPPTNSSCFCRIGL